MAKSGHNDANVGSNGAIRVVADVISQSESNNTSTVRIRGYMQKRAGSTTSHGTATMSTSATSGGTQSGSRAFSVPSTSWTLAVENTHTVSHAADGTRRLTATFTLGSTGTSDFGNGGSVSTTFNIDRIPRSPSKPGKPTISNVTNNSLRGNLASAPANNGASIIEYGWQFENVDTGGTATATTSGRTWNLTGRAANTRYRVRVRARNSVGWGPYSDWSGTVTTKVNPPAAPTNVDFVRQSDTRHVVSWSRNVSGNAPYTSQRVQRQTHANEEWGNWENLPTVSATATSYTDTTTQPNRAYRWRVQAVNATGSAVSAQSGPSRTTPAPPVDVSARKVSGSDDIRVTFTWRAGYASAVHEVQDNPGGAGWVTIGTTSDRGEFVHADPDQGVSHQYRVRAVSSDPTLYSTWSASSNVVQLIAPPVAPSLIGPQGAVDRDEVVRLEYLHNPVDTTDQTVGQVRWRVAGGTWSTVNTGTNSFYDLPAPGTSGTFEWQARTRGAHATFGPWSATWSFDAVSRPEVVIQTPEAVLEESQVEVVWGYQNIDASGQSRWETVLLDADEHVLATGVGSGTTGRYLFPTILDNETEYTVRVRARSGSGLWSEWDTSTFVTDFPLPYPVEILAEWDRETGSVALTFDVDDTDPTETVPDSLDVQRDDGDGWITIAVDLDPETSIVDYTPRLGEIRYRTISRTDLPTARTGPETATEPPRGLWPVFLNGGPDLGDVVAIYDNTALAFDRERAKTRHQWAGRDWPTTKWGQARSKTATLTATISPESPGATVADVEALEDMPSVVCARDILGHKLFVTIDNVSSDVERDGRWNVSIPMTREHYIEGVK